MFQSNAVRRFGVFDVVTRLPTAIDFSPTRTRDVPHSPSTMLPQHAGSGGEVRFPQTAIDNRPLRIALKRRAAVHARRQANREPIRHGSDHVPTKVVQPKFVAVPNEPRRHDAAVVERAWGAQRQHRARHRSQPRAGRRAATSLASSVKSTNPRLALRVAATDIDPPLPVGQSPARPAAWHAYEPNQFRLTAPTRDQAFPTPSEALVNIVRGDAFPAGWPRHLARLTPAIGNTRSTGGALRQSRSSARSLTFRAPP